MFDAGAPTPPVPSYLSNYIQPTFDHGLRIWWAFFWPTTVISAILGFAIEFGLRVIYEHTNVPGNLIGPVMRFTPYVISYVVALFIMEYIASAWFRMEVARTRRIYPRPLPALFESGGLIRGEQCCIGSSLRSWQLFRLACCLGSSHEFPQRKRSCGRW